MDDEEYPIMHSKITKWKNEPTVPDLKVDFDSASRIRDTHVSRVDNWLDMLHTRGIHAPKIRKGFSSIQPKMVRKQAEWRYAPLSEPFLSTENLFNVKPVTWEDKQAAEHNALILNNQFNHEIDKVAFIDEYVRTVVNEGTAILKVSWEFEEELQDVVEPVWDYRPSTTDEDTELLTLAQQGAFVGREEWEIAVKISQDMQEPIIPVKVAEKTVSKYVTTINRPAIEVCDYRNVTFDPSCDGDLSKASFVIYSFETSLAELRKNPNYTNIDEIQIDSISDATTDPDHGTNIDDNFQFSDRERKVITAYEYWGLKDIEGKGELVPIVATWVGDVMVRMEENPFPDKQHPFISVPYMPIRKDVYGEPDAELIGENQQIIGAITRSMIDMIGRNAAGQTGTRKGFLDAVNQHRFNQGMDYEFNSTTTPDNSIYHHTVPEIPQSAVVLLNLQQNEAESMSGVKAFNSGLNSQSLGEVATGIRGVLDASSKRELGVLRRLISGLIKVGRKIISMNAEFLNEKEVLRITNEKFIEIHKDNLHGKFDLALTISTAEEDNLKAQELAFMLQTVGNSLPMEFTQLILSDIAKLRKMPDLAHKISNFQPEPDPMAQRLAELEMRDKEIELAVKEAEMQKIVAEAELARAKATAEMAKVGKTIAETDAKNLEFIERESGVTQERELQKQSAQAKANMDRDVLLAQLKEASTSASKPAPISAKPTNEPVTDTPTEELPNAGI